MQKWIFTCLSLFFMFTGSPAFTVSANSSTQAHTTPISIPVSLEGDCVGNSEEFVKKWHYCHLKSEDGTEISLDYHVGLSGPYPYADYKRGVKPEISAQQIWFNVRNDNFTGNEKVQVIFIQKYMNEKWIEYGTHPILLENVYPLDLSPVAGEHKFTASLDHIPLARLVKFNTSIYEPNWQEIALVVDGKWLQDPISGSHNFQVDLLAPFKK